MWKLWTPFGHRPRRYRSSFPTIEHQSPWKAAGMRSAAGAGDAAAATTSARKRRFIVTSPPSVVVKRRGCAWRGAASDFGKSVAEVVVARLAGRAHEGGGGCNPDGGEPTSNRICF